MVQRGLVGLGAFRSGWVWCGLVFPIRLWCGKAGCVVLWFWCVVVRFGVLGPGVFWLGLVWHGKIRYGMARFFQ